MKSILFKLWAAARALRDIYKADFDVAIDLTEDDVVAVEPVQTPPGLPDDARKMDGFYYDEFGGSYAFENGKLIAYSPIRILS